MAQNSDWFWINSIFILCYSHPYPHKVERQIWNYFSLVLSLFIYHLYQLCGQHQLQGGWWQNRVYNEFRGTQRLEVRSEIREDQVQTRYSSHLGNQRNILLFVKRNSTEASGWFAVWCPSQFRLKKTPTFSKPCDPTSVITFLERHLI